LLHGPILRELAGGFLLKTFYFGFFGVFTLIYLAYVTWLTGYKAGYNEGADKAWSSARRALYSTPAVPGTTPMMLDAGELPTATAASPWLVPVHHSPADDERL
jgi:hypothetical protein